MKPKTQIIIHLFASFLFYAIFWKEGAGANYLLFTLSLTSGLCIIRPEPFKTKTVQISLGLLLLSSLAVVWHASVLGRIMYWLSLFVFTGFVWQEGYKSVLFALRQVLLNLFVFIKHLRAAWRETNIRMFKNSKRIFKFAKISIIPCLILFLFFFLYRKANPAFLLFSDSFIESINTWFTNFFGQLDIVAVLFYTWGFWITGVFFFDGVTYGGYTREEPDGDMVRHRRAFLRAGLSRALENEYFTALITFSMVNVVTGIVNLIDLQQLWLGYSERTASELSQYVHSGTYLLIFSVLLAAGIVLFFFRRNLNYFKKSRTIKYLAYLWIAQNLFMVLSVGVRNYHYIHEYGLAYKRLGVVFFLAIVSIGLISLVYKLYARKTIGYLIKFNGWSAFVVLLVVSWINWDILIARYNIHYAKNEFVDAGFLLSLSPKTYPYLEKHKEEIEQRGKTYYHSNFGELLYSRKDEFFHEYDSKSWLSWSYEAQRAYKSIKNHDNLISQNKRTDQE